jgi:hypothetical protein
MARTPSSPRMVINGKGRRFSVPADRLREAQLRRGELFRELVMRTIRGGDDPSREDLARALLETPHEMRTRVVMSDDGGFGFVNEAYRGTAAAENDTREILEYVVRTYLRQTRPQKPGPKGGRTLDEEMKIARAYVDAKAELLDAKDGIDDIKAIENEARRRAAAYASKQ